MDNIEVISLSTYIFMIYLLLALFIERVLEILMAAFQYLEWRFGWYAYWNRKAADLQRRFDRYQKAARAHGVPIQQMLNDVLAKFVVEPEYPGGRAVVSAGLVRLNAVRLATRIIGFLLALLLVITQDLDFIQVLYRIFESVLPQQKIIELLINNQAFRILLTAAAISVGSEPLHQIISKIEELAARKTRPAAQA